MAEVIEVVADTEEKLMQKIRSDYGEEVILHQTCQRKKTGLSGLFGKVEFVASVIKNPTPLFKISPSPSPLRSFSDRPKSWERERLALLSVAKSHLTGAVLPSAESPVPAAAETKRPLPVSDSAFESAAAESSRVLEINQKMNETLSYIKSKMEQLEPAAGGKVIEIEPIRKIREWLVHNDFSEDYIRQIIQRFHSQLSLSQLNDSGTVKSRLAEWIRESLLIAKPDPDGAKNGKARVSVLIGPTGVGKTTTMAKMAGKIVNQAESGDKRETMALALLTIDVYRIGAAEQVKTYGEIMDAPFEKIFTKSDFEANLVKYQHYKHILVDTIGRSPKEKIISEEMRNVLSGCLKSADVYLVLSASTRERDLEAILDQFDKFNYQSVILTKVDETSCIGNVISALAKKKKPIAYIANGQVVPNDFMEADADYLMNQLDSFDA